MGCGCKGNQSTTPSQQVISKPPPTKPIEHLFPTFQKHKEKEITTKKSSLGEPLTVPSPFRTTTIPEGKAISSFLKPGAEKKIRSVYNSQLFRIGGTKK